MPSIKCWVTRFLVVLSLLGLFTAVTYRLHGGPRQGVDDADITLVYATNLGQGHGFVYNQGGERVEGFTSALWTVTEALDARFSWLW